MDGFASRWKCRYKEAAMLLMIVGIQFAVVLIAYAVMTAG